MSSEALAALVAEVKVMATEYAAISSAEQGITAALFTQDPEGARILAMLPEFGYGSMGRSLVGRVLGQCRVGTACVLVHEVFHIPEAHRARFYEGGRRIVNARDLGEAERAELGVGDALVILAWVHEGALPDLLELDTEVSMIARDRQSVGEWMRQTMRRPAAAGVAS